MINAVNSIAVIFDMDGVIVDSNPYHKIALNQFCRKYGYFLSEEELRSKIYGRTNKEWIINIFGQIPDAQLTQLAQEKEALYRQLYEKDIIPVPGLIDFLKLLDEYKILRAIGTSAPFINVKFTLSRTGIQDYFSIMLDESHVKHGKPDPEIYLNVAKALNKPPQQCIVIEDSLSGITAAKRAGCKVVAITTTHCADELDGADFIINDFLGLDPSALIHKLYD